jgi:hypothetical protein
MLSPDTDTPGEPPTPQLIDTGTTTRTAASPAVITFPGDPGWDDARRAWNLAVDQRPAAVALPETVDDVVAAVDYARTVGLRVAVQGTGHGARHDLLDGTLLVNTARMTGVEIDADARVAVSRPGPSGSTSSTPQSSTVSPPSTAPPPTSASSATRSAAASAGSDASTGSPRRASCRPRW